MNGVMGLATVRRKSPWFALGWVLISRGWSPPPPLPVGDVRSPQLVEGNACFGKFDEGRGSFGYPGQTSIRSPQITKAELCGLFEGLSLAWRSGFRVKHVFREGNRLADGLARLGHGKDYGQLECKIC
ncbi:hypothetical protein LWI29_012292 [Acer saccharum]|uniref:RNase H type-1 domain-containing protein n=1 Tax=Acer saccharum TaxID=4024 RepID=A0AA39SL38_ACESA|nr:hypothetical protein LWI29_012292 [Acer saccharum]